MAFNGRGTFIRSVSEYIFGNIIDETQVNAEFNDINDGLSNCITKDGQTSVTQNIPFNDRKITGLAEGSGNDHAVTVGQVQNQAYVWCETLHVNANAVALIPSPHILAYKVGQHFRWISGTLPNTDSMTLAISGLSPLSVQQNFESIRAGAYEPNRIYEGVLNTLVSIQLIALHVADSAKRGLLGVPTVYKTAGEAVFTKNPDAKFIVVEAYAGSGGGGSGGSGAPGGGGGGGGGQYVKKTFLASTIGETTTIIVGVNGSGGFGPRLNGSNGTSSSFGTFAATFGHGGGRGGSGAGGAGGRGGADPVNCDLCINGSNGGNGGPLASDTGIGGRGFGGAGGAGDSDQTGGEPIGSPFVIVTEYG